MKKREKQFLITWIMLIVMGAVSEMLIIITIPDANNLEMADDAQILSGIFIYAIMYAFVTVFNSSKHPVKSYVLSSLVWYLLAVVLFINTISIPNIIRGILIFLTLSITAVQLIKEEKNADVSQEK